MDHETTKTPIAKGRVNRKIKWTAPKINTVESELTEAGFVVGGGNEGQHAPGTTTFLS